MVNSSVIHNYRIAPNNGHQVYFGEAFIQGLRLHGLSCEVRNYRQISKCDIAVVWSAHHVPELQCTDYIIMERGFVGGRVRFTSVGWNGLNGRADFKSKHSPADRRIQYGIEPEPWKLGGDYILVMGQVAGDAAVKGLDLNAWYKSVIEIIRSVTDKPVRFRPHPLSRSIAPDTGIPVLDGDLFDVLDGASLCVTWNSNSGVDAVMAGVPTIALDPGSMAWPVTSHDLIVGIHHPHMPDRMQWLNNLMYSQWTVDEIRSGLAWEHLTHDNDINNCANG